jgi:hypothetical protein
MLMMRSNDELLLLLFREKRIADKIGLSAFIVEAVQKQGIQTL